jgi:hypothetical protein
MPTNPILMVSFHVIMSFYSNLLIILKNKPFNVVQINLFNL